jgi:23S rRNA pseudouridine1911/1915/1917 synthase
MSSPKHRPPRIPPGAPGHPREAEAGPSKRHRTFAGRGERQHARAERPAAPAARRRASPAAKVTFVYEDAQLVAVDKPEGLAVIAPEGSRSRNLYDIVTEHLRRANPRARAAVVHRIDRDTSGIVIFAKDGATKRLLMSRWNELVTERRYVALVEGRVKGVKGALDSYLAEEGPSRMRIAEAGERGALRAISRWKLLAAGSRYSLLELELETGRKHQIRVQLSSLGHPVAGDERYGAHSDPLGRLCLHALSIALKNPASGEPLRIESDCPPEFRAAVDRDAASAGRAFGPPRGPKANGRGASASASRREPGSAPPRRSGHPRGS